MLGACRDIEKVVDEGRQDSHGAEGAIPAAHDRNGATAEQRCVADGGKAQPPAPIFHFTFHEEPLGAGAGRHDHGSGADRGAFAQFDLEASVVSRFDAAGGILDMFVQVADHPLLQFVDEASAPDGVHRRLATQHKWIADFAPEDPD